METQKIVNLLNSSENEFSNLQQKKWYIIHSDTKGNYSHKNPFKFWTSSLETSLCDYSEAYVLVTGNIAVVGADNNTKAGFKNCATFRKCKTQINDTFIDEEEHINITIPMYNLTEYSLKEMK